MPTYRIMVPELWLVEWEVVAATPEAAKMALLAETRAQRLTTGNPRLTGDRAYCRPLPPDEWEEEGEDATPYAGADGWEIRKQ